MPGIISWSFCSIDLGLLVCDTMIDLNLEGDVFLTLCTYLIEHYRHISEARECNRIKVYTSFYIGWLPYYISVITYISSCVQCSHSCSSPPRYLYLGCSEYCISHIINLLLSYAKLSSLRCCSLRNSRYLLRRVLRLMLLTLLDIPVPIYVLRVGFNW